MCSKYGRNMVTHMSSRTKHYPIGTESYVPTVHLFAFSEAIQSVFFNEMQLTQYYSRSLRSAQSRRRVPSFQHSIIPIAERSGAKFVALAIE